MQPSECVFIHWWFECLFDSCMEQNYEAEFPEVVSVNIHGIRELGFI